MRGTGRWRRRLCLHSVSLFKLLFARPTTAVVGLTLMEDFHGWILWIDFSVAHSALVCRHRYTSMRRDGLRLLRHVPTQVHAALKDIDTRLRGIHVVLLAFLQTRLTHVGTDPGVLLVEF